MEYKTPDAVLEVMANPNRNDRDYGMPDCVLCGFKETTEDVVWYVYWPRQLLRFIRAVWKA